MKKCIVYLVKRIAALESSFFVIGFIVSTIEKNVYAARHKKHTEYSQHICYGPYEKYFKRPLDFSLSLLALIFFGPLILLVALLVKINMGSPVIFKQLRPGLNEEIFELHKFRTMTNSKDENGKLLSDEKRLTEFGKKLRSSSFDELPELFDILIGRLSIVGPRPQLVRDMVFMSDEHRKRHEVVPGLTGLAQVSGRNSIDWEQKLHLDIEYSRKITFIGDMKIIFKTIRKVLLKDGITENDAATATDYGDYLLINGWIDYGEYKKRQKNAEMLLDAKNRNRKKILNGSER